MFDVLSLVGHQITPLSLQCTKASLVVLNFYSALTLTYFLINFHLTFQQNIGIFWCHGVNFFSASSSDEQMPHLRMVLRTHLTGYLLYLWENSWKLGMIGDGWGWITNITSKNETRPSFYMTQRFHGFARDPGVRPRRVMGRDKPRFQGHPRNFWVSTEAAEKKLKPSNHCQLFSWAIAPVSFFSMKDVKWRNIWCSWSKSIKEEHPQTIPNWGNS